jgi:ATP-dependent helicase/nuclease subunit B
MPARANVFTIPASAPFVPVLIRALVGGELVAGFPASHDPLALASATLYLPTRRACRLARDLFLQATGADAAILPRIVPIGDIDEDELVFASMATGVDVLDLAPALGSFERRLLLAKLIQQWAASPDMRHEGGAPLIASSPAAALALADDLARLMDDMITRGVSWDRLDELVPDRYDQYWQLTLDFLKIAREAWPKILAERNAIEATARRDALIKAEAARLAKDDGPVIAAGSTGSMPATADLIATIAKLPHGAVVLPGLDTGLDEAAWEMIAGRKGADGREMSAPATGHPQFALQALLQRIGIERADVKHLGEPAPHGRERLLSEALRPAYATERWRELGGEAYASAALDRLAVIEAANTEEEALAIAVALREAADTPGETAALITPDRGLARRVASALARWNVAVDDSGGDALSDTPAGRFARLVAEAGLGGLEPVTLLALLKHPLTRLGAADGANARAVATLESAILRGPRPSPGSAGLAHALASFREQLAALRRGEHSDVHPSEPRARLFDDALDAAAELVTRLSRALAPLENLTPTPQAFTDLAARHYEAIIALSSDQTGVPAAFAGTDGKALDEAFADIATQAPGAGIALVPADYEEFFRAAIDGRTVRRPEQPGVRVRIYGPLEARLQSAGRVALGGLVEGIWPPETRGDPWLSRPMRHALGLDLPERRISLSAHDFAQAMGAREVVLSYAAKVAGAPTVISRFVQRLAAVAGETRWNAARAQGERYLVWARELDRPVIVKPVPRPTPRPPLDARPKRLSVTEIEHWLRDPYTIYAKHILRLHPLDPVDTPPGARDRGIVIHGAVGEFAETFAQALPADPLAELLAIGRKHFAALEDFPEAKAFWWPRFERIARWFVNFERERRANVAAVMAEIHTTLDIPLGARTFTLSARADRIERLNDGRYAILDYKTGTVPTSPQVKSGLSPQLTLEAAMLRAGAFKDIAPGGSVAELTYIGLKGRTPPGEIRIVQFDDSTPDAQADNALRRLTGVARRFEDEAQPYYSLVSSMWRAKYGDYDHLARVKEWSLAAGIDDPEIP